jgi:predicted O-methyltransferase YrrM
MTNSLHDPKISSVLDTLFAEADRDHERHRDFDQAKWLSGTPQQMADQAATVYMPVSRRCGELLYLLVRATRPRTIVEYGTSFAISTVHLAAAVRDNGVGHIYGSEMSIDKLAAARDNIATAGLADLVTVLPGDARDSLSTVEGPIDFVLLDGWKDLSIPVLTLLEPKLSAGALVIADDIDQASMTDYLDYVRNRDNGYSTVAFPVDDGMEISCRVENPPLNGPS